MALHLIHRACELPEQAGRSLSQWDCAELARQLVNGGVDLEPSQNAYDWIGHGRYAWEDSPDRAWQWAHEAVGDAP